MKYQAIIFDMDGVIIDSEKLWANCNQIFLKQFTAELTEDDLQNLIGGSICKTHRYLHERYSINIDLIEFEKQLENYALENIYPFTNLMPGVLNLIKKLHNNNKPIGLGSSSQRVWMDYTLDKHQIKEYFQTTISRQEVSEAKPDPEIYLKVAYNLQIQPEKCLVIEDSYYGAMAGKKAGMTVFGYKNGLNDSQDLSMADYIFDDFNNLEF